MAFPAIPSGARALTAVDASTGATRTFPSLSGLTKNSGDLLIAIVLGYQSTATANAVWSGWGGGFTEFGDFSSTTTCALGMAYKWSTGSETGTFTVTQGSAITGHAAMILLSISGAHASTIPEAVGAATGSNSNADPGSLNPGGWDVADTLWIAVCGLGETSTSGAWDGISSGPSGYSGYVETGTSGDAVGAVELAVAFLQSAAASVDPGTFTNDASNARWRAATIGIRPAPANVTGSVTNTYTASVTTQGTRTALGQTSLTETVSVVTSGTALSSERKGQVSWASFQTPVTGSTTLTETVGVTTQGTKKALGQTTLTESVGIVTQGIKTAVGQTTLTETVGIVTSGTASTPTQDYFGETSLTLTDSITTSATRTTFGKAILESQTPLTLPTIVSQTTFAQDVPWTDISNLTADDGNNASVTVDAPPDDISQDLLGYGLGLSVGGLPTQVDVEVECNVPSGATLRVYLIRFGDYEASDYQEIIGPFAGTTTLEFTPTTYWVYLSNLLNEVAEGSGFGVGFAAVRNSGTPTVTVDYAKVRVISTGIDAGVKTSGTRITDSSTILTETVGITTQGEGIARGQTTLTESASLTTNGTRTTFSQETLTETVDITTSGTAVDASARRGEVSWATFETPTAVIVYGSTSLALTASVTTTPHLTAFGRTTLTESASVTTSGSVPGVAQIAAAGFIWLFGDSDVIYGNTALTEAVGITTSGRRTVFGQTSLAVTASVTTNGVKTSLGQTSLAETVSITTQGTRTLFGAATLIETVGIVTSGTRPAATRFGIVTLGVVVDITTLPTLSVYGAVVLPISVSITTTPRSLIFLIAAVCNDLTATSEICDDLSLNGASSSTLVLTEG